MVRFFPRATGVVALPALVALSLVSPFLAAAPARAADAVAGRSLAERWCASCHVVGTAPQSAASDAPTFAAIAARDGDVSGAPSGSWLAFRLLKPHPQMPQVSLTRTEAADLAAYFATLKK
ncbi:c-type cytochrome [Xanthobacter aminoxidans]|uniref:c-type cytochrome n=1 Tax=Xanthobacter aminoxidans TaxID=186280 RepID=UPI00372C40C0